MTLHFRGLRATFGDHFGSFGAPLGALLASWGASWKMLRKIAFGRAPGRGIAPPEGRPVNRAREWTAGWMASSTDRPVACRRAQGLEALRRRFGGSPQDWYGSIVMFRRRGPCRSVRVARRRDGAASPVHQLLRCVRRRSLRFEIPTGRVGEREPNDRPLASRLVLKW